MSSEKLIIISSEDKDNDSSTSNSDFVVNLKEKYYTQNVLKTLVKEATVPNVFPNIRGQDYGTSQNNIIRFLEGGVQRATFLPEGQYIISAITATPPDPWDFVAQLNILINAETATSVVVVTYNELTNKLEFEVTAGPNVTFQTKADGSSISDVLGLTNSLFVPSGLGAPLPAQGTVQLSGYQNVYLHSKEIADTNAIDGDFGLISVVEPISLADTEYNSYAYKQNNDDELAQILYEQPRNLSRIRITLRDNLGNVLPIGTAKINLVLKAYLASG